MTDTRSGQPLAVRDWPTFALRYTFNPDGIGLSHRSDPDEVVVFDATRGRPGDRWIAAKRDSYVSIEKIR